MLPPFGQLMRYFGGKTILKSSVFLNVNSVDTFFSMAWLSPIFSSVAGYLGWGCRRYGMQLEHIYPLARQIAHYSQILIYASSMRLGSNRPAFRCGGHAA